MCLTMCQATLFIRRSPFKPSLCRGTMCTTCCVSQLAQAQGLQPRLEQCSTSTHPVPPKLWNSNFQFGLGKRSKTQHRQILTSNSTSRPAEVSINSRAHFEHFYSWWNISEGDQLFLFLLLPLLFHLLLDRRLRLRQPLLLLVGHLAKMRGSTNR